MLSLFSFLWILQAKAEFNLISYNAGLAYGYVGHAKERAAFLPLAIQRVANQTQADVICLQEVWEEKDIKAISKKLKADFPFQFIPPKEQSYALSTPACQYNDLFGEGRFVTCLQKECSQKKDDEFTACLSNKCGTAMKNLVHKNRSCADALFAQVGKNPIVSIARLLNPLFKIGRFGYDGAVGTMLLSKHPFVSRPPRFIDMASSSTTIHRGALNAEIKKDDANYNITCTHLTANLDLSAPYAGPFHSWPEENLKQVEKLLWETTNLVSNNVTNIMAGDFNCSLAFDSLEISGDFEKSCEAFAKAGFSDPLALDAPECTFCLDNSLVQMTKETKNYQLDHTFVSGPRALFAKNKVLFKNKVKLKEKAHHLSDHFGLLLTIP